MKKILVVISFAVLFLPVFGQPFNPNNPVPLDGGISLLLATGAAFGAKKIHDSLKKD